LPLERVAALKAAITEAVKKRFPGAELTIVADPRTLDNETIVDLHLFEVRSVWMQVSNCTIKLSFRKLNSI
jgi:hypothetical protein